MLSTPFRLALMAGLVGLAVPATAQLGQRDPAERIGQADANRDGVVTRAEFAASRLERFSRMDRNGDGAISRDDFGRILRLRPQAGEMLDNLLAEADANHDGRVTKAELDKAPMPLFDRADANHDSRIDRQELATVRGNAEAFRAQRGR